MSIAPVTDLRDVRDARAAASVDRLALDLPVDLIAHLPDADDATPARRGHGDSFDRVQSTLQSWLRTWQPQRLPAFTPVRDISPEGEPGASGLKSSPSAPDGAVRVTASLYDPPTRGEGVLAWSRNWASTMLLPPARESGRLFYRFRVSSRLVLDGQADLGLVSTSANFGVVADAAKADPFETPGFQAPIVRPLVGVRCTADQDVSASEVFEGSIAVRQGETPAMAFVVGTELRFENGWVRVHEGTSTWIGPVEPGATGTVEYRYAPTSLLRVLGHLD
ncbi:hypothetical protein [Agromyces aureus]|uniref:Uncharacterized protein n=1 Tax=Agromyces aureus TaxID=453304 RepID=A0A191WHL3_9MICO|nr:hypothetical protein [Agromyces aureus]ANJ27746.1 hypothetical protein ATC03_14545 [Agromyces aureus]